MPLEELVEEGMQQPTNSAPVVVPFRGGDITNPRYRLTRAGRAASSRVTPPRASRIRVVPTGSYKVCPHEGRATRLWPKGWGLGSESGDRGGRDGARRSRPRAVEAAREEPLT
ncbi:MAG: hypothetical protein LC808_40080 [Actinobacteria bacterium]|nr:hypothetical protein [Actinomycetota bacterium]